MIRTAAVPRSVRIGTALVSVAGIAGLAGCGSGTGTTATEEKAAPAASPAVSTAPAPAPEASAVEAAPVTVYADGTYSAEGSYRTPESTETVQVEIAVAGDIVTAVEVTGDPQAAQSRQYQSRFIGGIADEVVGRSLDEVSVDRVAGSSLTSGGFMAALDTIKQDAAA